MGSIMSISLALSIKQNVVKEKNKIKLKEKSDLPQPFLIKSSKSKTNK